MPSKTDSKKHQYARKIGNTFIRWKISQYALTSAISNLRFISPIFEARGHSTTKWQITLWPYFEENTKTLFKFRLERFDKLHPNTVVAVNWNIILMTIEESLICMKTGQTFFKGNSIVDYMVSDDPASIYKKLHTKSDTLLLCFQIIVSHRDGNNIIEPTPDIGLKSLSRDLFALYKRGLYTDVEIRLPDKNIRAHKAILQCRSPYFKDFFEQHKNEDVLDIKEFYYEAVNKMFSYLYSGKLEFVLGKPTIARYECAERFQIEEVKRYYALDKFELDSKMDLEEISDVWQIKNFESVDEPFIESPLFTESVSTLFMRLMLYPKGHGGNCNAVSIQAKFHCVPRRQYLIALELGILNSEKELIPDSKVTSLVQDNLIMDVCDWDYTFVNSNVSSNGTLSISVKLQVSDGRKPWKTVVTPTLYNFSNLNETENSYSRLSNDISSLLSSGSFSDISFVSDYKDFKLHKCILVARCHAFKKQITEFNPVHLSCKTMDIKSDKISILMDYLYSGILNSCNLRDISEVYDVADKCLLLTLKVIVSQNMQKNLTVENVSDFLLFAEKKRDRELKLSALKFISINSSAVFSQQNFQQLKVSHLHLYGEAHEFSRSDTSGFTSLSHSEILPKSE